MNSILRALDLLADLGRRIREADIGSLESHVADPAVSSSDLSTEPPADVNESIE